MMSAVRNIPLRQDVAVTENYLFRVDQAGGSLVKLMRPARQAWPGFYVRSIIMRSFLLAVPGILKCNHR